MCRLVSVRGWVGEWRERERRAQLKPLLHQYRQRKRFSLSILIGIFYIWKYFVILAIGLVAYLSCLRSTLHARCAKSSHPLSASLIIFMLEGVLWSLVDTLLQPHPPLPQHPSFCTSPLIGWEWGSPGLTSIISGLFGFGQDTVVGLGLWYPSLACVLNPSTLAPLHPQPIRSPETQTRKLPRVPKRGAKLLNMSLLKEAQPPWTDRHTL